MENQNEEKLEENGMKKHEKLIRKYFNKCRIVATIMTIVLPPLGAIYWLALTKEHKTEQ